MLTVAQIISVNLQSGGYKGNQREGIGRVYNIVNNMYITLVQLP